MKKSGKAHNRLKIPNPKKNENLKKNLDIDEEPEFSSEDEYMNYVGLKNEMKNEIHENFDDPFAFLMGNSDNIITKSTYTKIEYENGKPINEELYQSESVKHKDKKGHNITEKKEKYKNNKTGIEKVSHQKLLDGKGTKIIKKINLNNGNREEHNIYKGIKENNVKDFNKKYNRFKEKVKLDDMFQKVKLLGNKRNNDEKDRKILLLGDGKEQQRNKMGTNNTRTKNKKK
jgi:hypothetical protein